MRHRFVDGAFVVRGEGGGQVGFADQFQRLLAHAITAHEMGEHRHGALRCIHTGQDRAHRGFQFFGHAVLPLDGRERLSGDRCAEHGLTAVHLRDHQVGGLALAQGFANHPLQLVHAVVGREHGAHASGFGGEGLEAVVDRIAQVVVGDQPLLLDAFAGHAHQMEHRQPMGFAAHHAIDRRQLTHAVGGGEDGGTADTGVAIGGVGGIQFVGAGHPGEAGHQFRGIVDREGVVARHSEDPIEAELRQTAEGVLGNAWSSHGPEVKVRGLTRLSGCGCGRL